MRIPKVLLTDEQAGLIIMENLKHKGLGMLNRIKGEGRNNITSFENQPKKISSPKMHLCIDTNFGAKIQIVLLRK